MGASRASVQGHVLLVRRVEHVHCLLVQFLDEFMHAFAFILEDVWVFFVLGSGLEGLVLEGPLLELVLRREVGVLHLVAFVGGQVSELWGVRRAQEAASLKVVRLILDGCSAVSLVGARPTFFDLLAAAISDIFHIHLKIHSIVLVAERLWDVLVLVQAHGV